MEAFGVNWFRDLGELGLAYVPRIVGFLALVIGAWVLAAFAGRTIRTRLGKSVLDKTLAHFVGSFVQYGLLAAALVGALGMFGFETASFAAVLAAGGLAVGLAFQGTLSNFAAGFMLLIFRPFKAGDVVKVAGEVALVEAIELFTTDLRTFDNRRVIVPNSQIFGSKIENITHYDTRRVDFTIGVAYSADIDHVRGILESIPAKIPEAFTEPAPQVVLTGLGASSVDWSLRIWCTKADYWTVYQAGYRALKYALDQEGVSIPFPQMDVHLDPRLVDAVSRASGRAPAKDVA